MAIAQITEQLILTATPEQASETGELLSLLEREGFADASGDQRETQLRRLMADTPVGMSAQRLKSVVITLFYALPDHTGRNPNWSVLRYPGPRTPPSSAPKPITPITPQPGAELTRTCALSAMGPGGGVVAGELAQRGLKVIVLKMGGYYAEADFDELELSAYQRLYFRGGPFPTEEDGQILVFAGFCLGGGTTVNWSNCVWPFAHVREEWAREHGIQEIDSAEFDWHLDAVAQRISVNDRCSELNGTNRRLAEGADRLGYSCALRNAEPEAYPRESAGFLGYGDRSGSKQSTAKTYLRDAYERGATIIVRCRAQRRPAYLEATSERAVAFYYRHGFEVADEVRLKKGPPLWLMWRDERGDSVGE